MNTAPPLIMDIEASGFGSNSYPIEIGVVGENCRYCALIKPAESWTHWDDQAAEIHGISRDVLERNGHQIREVAEDLNQLLAGKTLYSDGWVVDLPWLRTLFLAAGLEPQFHLSPIESILTPDQLPFWEPAYAATRKSLALQRHRASNDAYLIQQTWLLSRHMMVEPPTPTASISVG